MNTALHQPIHTVYGGGHLFRYDVAAKLGSLARKTFEAHRAHLPGTPEVHERVWAQLQKTPVQDLRIDFEDGYGYRSDEEEDTHARQAAQEVKRGLQEGTLPPMLGVRPKAFHVPVRTRALRTLRIFFGELRRLPDHFAVTLPKPRSPEEVEDLRLVLAEIAETAKIEVMIETPEALRNISEVVEAAGPHVRGVHFGPYDFSSACGIAGAVQGLRHPLCTYARHQILVALAGSGVWLSDGPTAVLPLGDAVAAAWRTQWDDIRNALSSGFYQGWDLHPAQIPLRYAAVFSFFHDNLPPAVARMKNFQSQSAQATRVGSAFDDEATALGLRVFLDRAVCCGAVTATELASMLAATEVS